MINRKKIEKATILSQSRCKPDICLEGFMEQQETSVSMSGDMVEIQSWQHSKLRLETCLYTNPFGEFIYKCIIFGSAL